MIDGRNRANDRERSAEGDERSVVIRIALLTGDICFPGNDPI